MINLKPTESVERFERWALALLVVVAAAAGAVMVFASALRFPALFVT